MSNQEEYTLELLKLAQCGDRVAENNLLSYIRDVEMRRRIAKYLHKNRQVEDEDLMQEFMIGVALSIQKADLEIGNPIEYIIQQGMYRVRTYLRKSIIQNTTQICLDCGYESRLNRVGNHYECKKCGSTHIDTRETHEHDDIAIMNKMSDVDEYDNLIESMSMKTIVEEFRETLDKEGISNCEIVDYDNLTIEKAEELNCDCIIRGIRDKNDYEYERELDSTNRYLNSSIPTLFIPAIHNISSTMVRGLIENKFSIKRFVPEPIAEYYE
jgi:phosphopantetheine adenylyltransferase